MTPMLFALPVLAAALLSYLLTPLAGDLALRVGAVDQPGPRKIHDHPIPRLGGVAVVAALGAGILMMWVLLPARFAVPRRLFAGIALGVLPILGVSLADDMKPLRPGPKFAAHLAGAIIAVAFGVSLGPTAHLFGYTLAIGWMAVPLSVLWLVGVTNAFNIVDGLDGLCAGLALIAAVALCGVFMLAKQPVMAGASLVAVGALAGFLPYNMYPARMFFGDTGATAIGFLLAAFALRGGATLSAGFAALLPVFVLGLPIAETTISMARRLLVRLGRSGTGGVFEADRNHMHHRLLASGIDHPRAVLILYGAGVLLASGALASMLMSTREAPLLVVALLLAGFLGVQRLGYDEFAFIRNGTALRVYEAPVLRKSLFAVLADVLIVAVAAAAAVALKTDDWTLGASGHTALGMGAVLAPITVIVFWRMQVYRGTWRLAGANDFVRACCGVVVAALLGLIVRMVGAPGEPVVSAFAIYAFVATALLVGSRASYLVLAATQQRAAAAGAPTLIYGAGRKGATALRELATQFGGTLRPVGFIDDDPEKSGWMVNGMPVVGTARMIERAIRRFAVRAIVVASDSVPELRLCEVAERCEQLGVSLMRLHITLASLPSAGLEAGPALAPSAFTVQAAAIDGVQFEDAASLAQRSTADQACPMCHSSRLQRSHVRRMTERVHRKLTAKRLYRCLDCGWRGWAQALESAVAHEHRADAPPTPAVLDRIDVVLHAPSVGAQAS